MSTAKKKLTTCEPKTAVSYARYSSAKQRDVSIEQQLRDIRAFAEREGYTIIHEYADRAKSGFKHSEKRLEFQSMLQAAKTGIFDTVIAWKVDRFGRDRRESANYKGKLADLGVSVKYAMEPIPDGAAGCLTEGMLEAIAEWYSRNLSENTKRGHRDNAMKCIVNGGNIFGYRRGEDGHYIIEESEAAIVQKIFNLYASCNSACSICRILTKEGILTQNGVEYYPTRIIHMIRNETYAGVYHFGDIRIPGGAPAIISRDLWDTCQLQLTKSFKTHEQVDVNYYLSGKCICGKCGSNVYGCYNTGRKNKKYFYYLCFNRKQNNKQACDSPLYRKDDLENKIFDFIFNNLMKGKTLDAFVDAVSDAMKDKNKESPLSFMEKELKDINRKIRNLTEAIAEGYRTPSTKTMLEDLTDRAEQLKADIASQRLTESLAFDKNRILFLFQRIANGERDNPIFLRTVINTFINSITVYPNYLRVVINAAENVRMIPQDNLPPLEVLPDLSCFAYDQCVNTHLTIVEPYPAIAFKIAI